VSTTTPNNEKAEPAVPLQIELRDWFAGQAMASLALAMLKLPQIDAAETVAVVAYDLADKMILARTPEGMKAMTVGNLREKLRPVK
jgi:hypothetical protein